MNRYLVIIFLLLITIFGSFLRLANLENNPNGLYVDEASTGYNAWSILLTGKDEYGKDYPLAFRFLGSYTPPLYTYLTSLSIYLFGFSISSIRLTSAISGILMIPLIYLFIKSLNISKGNLLPLLGSFLFSILPWSIFFSRIGYEINLAFLIYFLGAIFLWQGLKNKYYLILAFAFLGLSVNAYHTQRFLSPLTAVVFIILFKETLLQIKYRKILLISFFVFFIFLLPQVYLSITPAGLNRVKGVFYFELLSSPILLIREFLSQYLTYFSPRNLFFEPDSDIQRSLPELSVFYSWMVIFYLYGLFLLIKERANYKKFVLMLLLLTPIPAALTGDPFASQRALPFLLPVLLITCIGINKFLTNKTKLTVSILVLLSFASLLYLYRSMAVFLPNERAVTWGYGYRQLADEINSNPDKKFILDTSRIKPAYIVMGVYLKIPPLEVQAFVNPQIEKNYYEDVNWDSYYRLKNFETRAINWEDDIYHKQILVGDEFAISEVQAKEHFLTKVFEIKSPVNEIIFRGFETNPDKKIKSL